jgi:hypothetical protein
MTLDFEFKIIENVETKYSSLKSATISPIILMHPMMAKGREMLCNGYVK